ISPNGAPVIEEATQDGDAPSSPASSPPQDFGCTVAALGACVFQVAIESRSRIFSQTLGERLEQVVAVPVGPSFIRRDSVQAAWACSSLLRDQLSSDGP